MNYQDYAPLAIRTAKFIEPIMDFHHAHMGMITEVGEIVDCFKKHYIYGKPLDLVHLEEEIGDCYWYLNLLANVTKNPMGAALDFIGSDKKSGDELILYLFKMAANAGSIAEGYMSPAYLQVQLEFMCYNFDIDLSKCLERNVAKLAARYGDKYSDYMALHRDTGKEGEAMK
jgi:NTP pyrophosphatase (non-canonical NTP hydrolase)